MDGLALMLAAALTGFAIMSAPAHGIEPLVLPPGAQSGLPLVPPAVAGRTLVPLHSSVHVRSRGGRLDFSATVTVHNVSADDPLVVESVEYLDASARPIERFEGFPVALVPYGGLQVLIAEEDLRGGTAASVIVDWAIAEDSAAPLIEAIMISTRGTQGYSFVAAGRRISRPAGR